MYKNALIQKSDWWDVSKLELKSGTWDSHIWLINECWLIAHSNLSEEINNFVIKRQLNEQSDKLPLSLFSHFLFCTLFRSLLCALLCSNEPFNLIRWFSNKSVKHKKNLNVCFQLYFKCSKFWMMRDLKAKMMNVS